MYTQDKTRQSNSNKTKKLYKVRTMLIYKRGTVKCRDLTSDKREQNVRMRQKKWSIVLTKDNG